MKNILRTSLLSVFLLVACGASSQAMLEYTFTGQSVGTYTPLVDPVIILSGTFDDITTANIAIPGVMFGNAERYTMTVSPNGWIAFGTTTSTANWVPLSSSISGSVDGVVAPLGGDLAGFESENSSVTYQIIGDSVIVQWQNLRRFGTADESENLSFQLIMDTGEDAMYFVYDVQVSGTSFASQQVGMKVGNGVPIAGQYANRSVTVDNTWLTSVAGTTPQSTCRLSNAAPATIPPSGLVYAWNGSPMGCMDAAACNYDSSAELDNGMCEYCSCSSTCGCTDPLACNYDSNAAVDDGSCYNSISISFDGTSNIFCAGDLVSIPPSVFPNNGPLQFTWGTDNNDVIISDVNASSFNALLNVPAPDFSTEIGVNVSVTDANGCAGTATLSIWADNCVWGCDDPLACNFEPLANSNDGTFCDYSCLGCTNESAWNYNPEATIDDGSCVYPGDGSSCDNPTTIDCGAGFYSAMTVGVANDNAASGSTVCGGPSNSGQRWYVYNAAFNSTVTVSTINSLTNFDTYLKVFTGSCGNFTCVGQNDDIPGTGFQSQVVFDAVEGETYFIRVGGFATIQGTFGLTFDCGGGCLDPEACNYDIDAPFDDGSCTFGADCYGCTDIEANNYSPVAVYDQGCQYSPSIVVFHDLDGDGLRSSNEPGLPNWPVYIPAMSATIFTNSSGAVSMSLPSSTFTVELVNTSTNWISSNSSSVSIDVPENMSVAFGLIPASGETFLVAGPYDGFWDIIHCTDGYESGVFINNTGSVSLNGTLTMTCDASFTPEADSYLTYAPDQVTSGFAQWNIVDFTAGSDGLFSFHIDGPGVDNIGTTYPFEFNLVLVDVNGDEIYNESWTTTPFVACSYDPNDLTPTPVGYADPHFILAGQRLQYRVRFQNTGNLPAEDILIMDQIDPQVFDLSTFQPLYGSDSYTACLHDDGTIDFIFNDIYLPDSENDEEGSHGFVIYEIFAREDVAPGTVLLNQANIFFDANPAIITNETFHTIFDCSSFTPMIGDAGVCEGSDVVFDATQDYVESYYWTLNNELVSTEATATISNLQASQYNLVLTTDNPLCEETHETTIDIFSNPTVDAGMDQSVCDGEAVVVNASSDAGVMWSDGVLNDVNFTPAETITLIATATNENLCSATDELVITVNELPSAIITENGNVLQAAEGASYQWYLNGSPIDGETNQLLSTIGGGQYFVIVTSINGCETTSETITVVGLNELNSASVHVYPNPMNERAWLQLPSGANNVTLIDMTGRVVSTWNNCYNSVLIERLNFASGLYQIKIENKDGLLTTELLID